MTTLWTITPSAGAADSRWLNFPLWVEVIVRAPSAIRARRVAAEMEAQMTADPTPVGNETLAFRSAFEDEKLYKVSPLSPAEALEHDPDGPEKVLSATLGSAPKAT
jgi:hypothetical protein